MAWAVLSFLKHDKLFPLEEKCKSQVIISIKQTEAGKEYQDVSVPTLLDIICLPCIYTLHAIVYKHWILQMMESENATRSKGQNGTRIHLFV